MAYVYFVPKKVAQSIRTPVNLISINDPWGNWAEFSVNHNLLKVGFINPFHNMPETSKQHLINDEIIQKIIDFVEPIIAKGEDIIVHCGEGSVRSPAIAMFIDHLADHVEDAPHYMPSGHYRNHQGTDHHFCRDTRNACVDYHVKKLLEGKTAIDIQEAVKIVEAANLEWREVYRQLDVYRLEGRRVFVKEAVDSVVKSFKDKS